MSYADAWSKWFDMIEGGAASLSEMMIKHAHLSRATRVLDIGTGLGEPATAVARSLPAGGRVRAIDKDPRMIAFASDRASKQGVDNIDFEVGDIENMALPESEYDAVLARWSLMSIADKPSVMKKLAATLRPGGRLVAGLWRAADRVPALTLAETAIYQHFGWSSDERSVRMAFSMADEHQVIDWLKDAGFGDILATPCKIVYVFDTVRSYIQYRQDVSDAVWRKMANRPESDWKAAFGAIERKLKPYATAEGRYHIVSHAYCVAAKSGGS